MSPPSEDDRLKSLPLFDRAKEAPVGRGGAHHHSTMDSRGANKILPYWNASSAAVVLLPLIIFVTSRAMNGGNPEQYAQNHYFYTNQNQQGQSLYDQQQYYQQQYQQRQYQNNQQQGQYNYNQMAQGQYDYDQYQNNQMMNQQWVQEPTKCGWWQWGCKKEYLYNAEYQGHTKDNQNPWWWLWSEDEFRRQQYEGVNPTVVIIYLWASFVFFGIVIYGYKTISSLGNLQSVSAALLVFANFSFLCLLYLGGLEGAIEDDGPAVIAYGWYGQFGVLVYLTHFFSFVFGLVFFLVIRRKASQMEITKVDVSPSDYLPESDLVPVGNDLLPRPEPEKPKLRLPKINIPKISAFD